MISTLKRLASSSLSGRNSRERGIHQSEKINTRDLRKSVSWKKKVQTGCALKINKCSWGKEKCVDFAIISWHYLIRLICSHSYNLWSKKRCKTYNKTFAIECRRWLRNTRKNFKQRWLTKVMTRLTGRRDVRALSVSVWWKKTKYWKTLSIIRTLKISVCKSLFDLAWLYIHRRIGTSHQVMSSSKFPRNPCQVLRIRKNNSKNMLLRKNPADPNRKIAQSCNLTNHRTQ